MRRGRDRTKSKSWVRVPSQKPSDRSLDRVARLQRTEEGEESSFATTMEKTVSDLVSSMKGMQSQFAQLLSKMDLMLEGHQQMSKDLKKFQGEVTDIKTSLNKTEGRLQQLEDFQGSLGQGFQSKVEKQEESIKDLKRKLIYFEDNARRNNIKIMNFSHKKEVSLKQEVIDWINTVMNSQHVAEEDIERVHFVGKPQRDRRPIIVKFFNYNKKNQFLKVIKEKPEVLVYRSDPVQIYQDLSSETIQWRKTMKPITSILTKNGKRYNWGYPVFLKIWKDGTLHKIHSFDEGKHLLLAWGIWDQSVQETSKQVAL